MDKYDPLVNSGDHARLKRAMSGALRGEKLCVAFIGGSITEGYSSTSHDKCYAKRIHDWWVRTFPDSGISYLNAGIGGTGSDYGCARVERDVLSHKPDVVFVDFTVNDPADDHYIETYEGLIRHLLLSPSQPAVVLLPGDTQIRDEVMAFIDAHDYALVDHSDLYGCDLYARDNGA